MINPPLVRPQIEEGLVNVPSSIGFGSEILPVEPFFIAVNVGILKTTFLKGIMHVTSHLVNYVLWPPAKSLKFLSKILFKRKKNKVRSATIREIAESILH